MRPKKEIRKQESDSPRKKKEGRPRMVLRLFDPRDDRVGGNEENDDFEQTSPLADKKMQ